MTCPNCGRETPAMRFCIHCGTALPDAGQPFDRRRRHAFAADPREDVLHLSAVSTLFPHLNPTHTHRVRWILLASATVIFLVGLGRLVPLSIVLAALLVPILYLIYFFVAEIHDGEPVPVLASTFAAGAVLGVAMSLAFYRVILSQARVAFAPRASYILLTAVGLTILGQLLMLVGPFVLFFTRRRFDDLLDGLAFGAASSLGFAAAQSVIYSWILIAGPFQRLGPAYSWALPVIRIALLVPLLDATTTGLICAAIWLRRDPHPPARYLPSITSVPVAVLLGVLGQIVPAVGSALLGGPILSLVWYAATLGALLLLARVVLHIGLIEKARPLGHGGTLVCPHCGHRIPDVAFCPHCGIALRSIARRDRRSAAPVGEEGHA
ncbi:MAG TPA: PrsW family glutamic-type intramembrane protease [Ktedonobacterales bacterium]|nr:PrsW family glutamic-type intramembrane protease [Ktedonobacterales bacterium]